MQHHHAATGNEPSAANLPTDRRALLAGIGGLAAGAILAGKANAGPLNPPPGPIQSTPGPEPRIPINSTNTPGNSTALFRITAPGSYYLTGNIVGQAGRSGISIESSGVTLDLMGFNMRGVPGSLDGISMTFDLPRIIIRNGTISGWGANGIRTRIQGGLIEGVNVSSNAAWGLIDSGGRSLRVSGCTAYENGAGVSNSGGIRTSGRSLIEACQAQVNEGTGLRIGPASTIMDCTTFLNSADGILVGNLSLAIRNNCSNNFGAGILLEARTRIEENHCSANTVGIQAIGSPSFIARNTCTFNVTNWTIPAGNRCLVIDSAGGPAVNGNSGGASPGSADPNANYTY